MTAFEGPKQRFRIALGKTVPLLVLVAGLIAFLAFDLERYLTLDSLREHRTFLLDQVVRQGTLAGLVYVVVYATAVAFSIPTGVFLTLIGGFLFGTLFGTAYAVIGATVGATCLFLAARLAFAEPLRRRAGAAVRRMESGFREHALSYLLILRLIPVFPFWLVNLVPAFLGVPLRTYVIGTFFGIIPATLVFASVGNGMGAILNRGGTPDAGIILEPEVLLPLIGLALLAFLPIVYKKWKSRKG